MALNGPGAGIDGDFSGEDNESLFANPEDRQLHLSAVASLSLKLVKPAGEVERLYSLVLKRLKKDAKVTAFLPLLASRRVTELFTKYPDIKTGG